MPQASHTYWAFLSYSSHDRAAAKALLRSIETYRVPARLVGRETPAGMPAPARFQPLFRDREELPASGDLTTRITDALAASAYLIVVCSPSAAKSRWVNAEIARFREIHGNARILAVIVDGESNGAAADCFPPAMTMCHDEAAATASFEPVAADIRASGDGHRLALLKLLAAMLGVGLDDLVRRDAQRRQRHLLAITVASLAALFITGILATAAIIGRNQAQRQRAHAEGLIEFMLTDLRKRLEVGGHLDAMDGVGREALKYYSAQNPSDESNESLGRRARALRLMGEISVQRGDLSEALTSFEAASASTGELLARSPSDGHAVFNHAQSVFWVGEMAHQRGDLDRAEAAFADYRDLAERLIAIDGSNDDWRAEIAYAQSARGVLLLEKGDAAGAVAAFQESLAVVDLLARRKPTSVDLKLELGQGHAWLADALEKEGRLASARKHRLAELSMYVDILAADGSVRQAKFSSIVALQTLGRLAILVDDWEHARQSFTEAASRAEALLSGERDNMDLTAVVAIVNVDLGEALLAGRRINDALIAQRRADTLLATARAHDAAVALWLNYGDRSALLAAEIARSRGDAAAALQLDESVLTRLAEGPMPRPNTDSFLAFVRAHVQAGDDLTALGRERDARQEWQAVIDGLPGEPGRYEPKLLKILAAAELRLGKAAEARQITERLLAASKGDPG